MMAFGENILHNLKKIDTWSLFVLIWYCIGAKNTGIAAENFAKDLQSRANASDFRPMG